VSDNSSALQLKRAVRQEAREARRSVTGRVARRAAQRIAGALCASGLLTRCQHVAGYLCNDGEPDLGPVFQRLFTLGKQTYLPVVTGTARPLAFYPYRPDSPLRPNRYGILEPVGTPGDARSARSIDLVLVPLVAFDATGNRLGMGGGFYDRTFAYLHTGMAWRRPCLVGVAYQCQRYRQLPTEAWDIPLQAIVTEAGTMRFTRGG